MVLSLSEIKLFLGNLSINSLLFVISLLLGIDEESVLELLLGSLDRSSGLDGIILLIIGVELLIFDSWLDSLLLLWVCWLGHLVSGHGLSNFDTIIGDSNGLLLVRVDNWLHVSLVLLELLLWGQILVLGLIESWEGSVDWVRLEESNSWNLEVGDWDSHVLLASLGESLINVLEIIVASELESVVLLEGLSHSILIHIESMVMLGL